LPRQTPLHDQHERLGARIVDFHGWELPVQYSGILAEHKHCRSAACVFDTSHMGQLLLRGDGRRIARVTTQNAAALSPGQGRYGFLLNEAGGILDDTILFRLDEDEYLLVVNAGTQDDDFAWLTRHLPDVALVNQSAAGWAKIDLQGPRSASVLAPRCDIDLAGLPYFGATRGRVCGHEAIVCRSGYTGELGYELFAPADAIAIAFEELTRQPEVLPAGLGARDSLRLEMGYPLYGDDISPDTTPLEAGLERFVTFDRDFIGAAALQAPEAAEPGRRLVAFESETRRRAWQRDALLRDGQEVGVVTSAAFGPSLDVSIGMGYVSAECAATGAALTVATRRGELPVVVAERPLYKHGTCRTREL
jgi:aminomethyltransferase